METPGSVKGLGSRPCSCVKVGFGAEGLDLCPVTKVGLELAHLQVEGLEGVEGLELTHLQVFRFWIDLQVICEHHMGV